MITIGSKVTPTQNIGRSIADRMKRALPLEARQKILVEEAEPVVQRMIAMAPKGYHHPHAADSISVAPVEGATPD